MSPINPKYIPKISQRYPEDIPKIKWRFPKDNSKYPKNIPKIILRYPKDIPKRSLCWDCNIIKPNICLCFDLRRQDKDMRVALDFDQQLLSINFCKIENSKISWCFKSDSKNDIIWPPCSEWVNLWLTVSDIAILDLLSFASSFLESNPYNTNMWCNGHMCFMNAPECFEHSEALQVSQVLQESKEV